MKFKYIQAASVNYLETIGLSPLLSANHIEPKLVSATCHFHKMLFIQKLI